MKINNKPKIYIPEADFTSEHFDDLNDCLAYNSLKKCKEKDIEEIVVEIPGENDGANWWWILKLRTGKFLLLSGGCDYTGWDCQSGIYFEEIYKTAKEATSNAPEKEEYYEDRNIKKNLLRQLENEQVFGTYQKEEE